ncbi:cytochrome b5 [Clostridium beijerinckii]|nr:cytochrome b5 [Clostridium beijerinckii]
MSTYFDFKTISELIGDNYYRQQKEFTLEELAQYDGSNGKPAYVAIDGIVYDLSKEPTWAGGTHFGYAAGQNLTDEFKSCHGTSTLKNLPKVGVLTVNNSRNPVSMNEGVIQDKSKFTPDDWVKFITPLVDRALAEAKAGINPEHLYQEFILSGILVGLGKNPQEAIDQVEEWEKDGTSQLLAKSKMNK